MNDAVRIEIQGLKEVQAKVEQMLADLEGSQPVEAMRDATLMVTRDAKIFAPVDTGRLRSSILPEVTVRKFPHRVQGVVGSRVEYAGFQEARKEYLAKALAKNWERIKELVGNVVSRIVSR